MQNMGIVKEEKNMTQFNPEKKEILTYEECLDPAMKITDQQDADQYFKEYISFIQKYLDKEPRTDEMTAQQIAKENLGYYAGYYNLETRIRIETLFKCSHPVFGKASNGEPTPEEALEAGRKLASIQSD